MQIFNTGLCDVKIIQPKRHGDSRGWFAEVFNAETFRGAGLPAEFVQDNQSFSAKGVLRGLHYQLNHPQSKLCRVVEGAALDVAVDIRRGSPYFGKWTSVVLSAKEHNQIYVPGGFAHGFLALTESVQFLYKCGDFYNSADEHGIAWNDPGLGISWGVEHPLVSEKDARHPALSAAPTDLLPQYLPK